MTARLTFIGIAAFWLTMNVLLWRSEYGSHGGEMAIPVQIVWRKILTAPDASSLSVYQNGERMGYCEFSTSIGQEMSTFEGDKPPPEELVKRAGYQIHLAGNVALGDFTNRVKFDSRIRFDKLRAWQEFNLKISSRQVVVEVRSVATNQTVHVKITADGNRLEQDLTFADLQNPGTLLRAYTGNAADTLLDALDLPDLTAFSSARKLEWSAIRTRVRISKESIPIYRLETSALGRTITMDVSTVGEILRVDLPGNISARIDEWAKP